MAKSPYFYIIVLSCIFFFTVTLGSGIYSMYYVPSESEYITIDAKVLDITYIASHKLIECHFTVELKEPITNNIMIQTLVMYGYSCPKNDSIIRVYYNPKNTHVYAYDPDMDDAVTHVVIGLVGILMCASILSLYHYDAFNMQLSLDKKIRKYE